MQEPKAPGSQTGERTNVQGKKKRNENGTKNEERAVQSAIGVFAREMEVENRQPVDKSRRVEELDSG